MSAREISPDDLPRICDGSDYVVILGGSSYAASSTRLVWRQGDPWPTMEADMADESILSELTGAMLGPNKESAQIEIKSSASEAHTIYANLASYVQRPPRLTLYLAVLRAEYV